MKQSWLFPFLFLFIFYAALSPARASAAGTRAEYEKSGQIIWETNTDEKVVAITFDDGPHPVFTPQILDLLAKYDAKATFFVAGNKVARFPDVLKRELAEGHEIANHTYTHPYDKHITEARLTAELEQTDALLERLTGQKPTLYRPVGGLFNDTIINAAVKNKKLVVLWSWHQDPRDWKSPPASRIASIITKGVQPGNIILLHDWNGTEETKVSQTVIALETILDFLDKNGYKCVTVSEMLYRSQKNMPEQLDPFR
ncbi:MAG: polysaccharide deacetylase family protein [Bacillus sp. (in: firmicutes)]